MTVAVAGAATTSDRALMLTLAVLCSTLADSDASIRAAAAELVESALHREYCINTTTMPMHKKILWVGSQFKLYKQ